MVGFLLLFVYFSDTKTLVYENSAAMPVIVRPSPQQMQTEFTTASPTQPAISPNFSPMIMANPYENKNERGKAFRQVLAAVVANLGNALTSCS